jgi:hypothetical protein
MEDWRRNLRALGAAEAFWKGYDLPRRGEYGGRCSNVLCEHTGADWYNRTSGMYYCDECARRINEACLAQGERKLCMLQPSGPTDLTYFPPNR